MTSESKFHIPEEIMNDLPVMVKQELIKLSDFKQKAFLSEYNRRKKCYMFLFWLIGCHYAYIGKWGVQILLWLSLFVMIGFLWWVIDFFRFPSLINNYNKDVAISVMSNLNAINISNTDYTELDEVLFEEKYNNIGQNKWNEKLIIKIVLALCLLFIFVSILSLYPKMLQILLLGGS